MLRLCKNTHDTFQYIYYSLRSIFIKDKVEPVMTSLHEITNGLTCFNMLDVLKSNIRLFEKALHRYNGGSWDSLVLTHCLMAIYHHLSLYAVYS